MFPPFVCMGLSLIRVAPMAGEDMGGRGKKLEGMGGETLNCSSLPFGLRPWAMQGKILTFFSPSGELEGRWVLLRRSKERGVECSGGGRM